MALAPRLDLRQSQSLVMTPQLQQAIKLLTLSNLEIESFIGEELERNPLLETDDPEPRREAEGDAGDASDASDAGADGEARGEPQLDLDAANNGEAPLDLPSEGELYASAGATDNSGALDGGLSLSAAGGQAGSGGTGEAPDIDNLAASAMTLHDHLERQAGACLSGQRLFIARNLIDHIDQSGYFTGDLLDLSQRFAIARDELEEVLGVIQTFDPSGVGARSLAECLAIQAKEADRYDPCMERLLANLDLLGKGALDRLEKICRVDREDLIDMIAELRAYNPKPGASFDDGRAEPVVPDIFVVERGEGWAIEINNASLPRLLINRRYYTELTGGVADKNSRAWLNQCLADANWLVKALDQRQRTIVKVASEIVKFQDRFFREGVEQLKPLTLRTVAEAIDMHESTVSRVTSNKYLACSRGTFELKYFFTSGIQSADGGEAVSAEAVKSHIKALIDAEDPKKILSDDKLVGLLQDKGFDIARRTVAKYREAMGIGSSVQRRRQKALAGTS